ncbi:hypothetical protein BS78_10G252600 [Paspalum vaginatum]|nr:hypothetical protein BS78_10G252600 [Paspalum vaginatum]
MATPIIISIVGLRLLLHHSLKNSPYCYPQKSEVLFPTSLLSNGSGNSIRRLQLSWCVFSTTIGLDCLKNLTSLSLHDVRITGDELRCLLSNSTALEHLNLTYCSKISCLNIPSHMKRLRCLSLVLCERIQVLLAESLHVKQIELSMESAISYARVKLPSVVPNLERLSICSPCEVLSLFQTVKSFLVLSYVALTLHGAAFSDAYDCFSLVSFLNAAPSLETFVLALSQLRMQLKSIIGDPSPLRQMVGHCHNHLKTVKIIGFCSAKSLVELACYILENAASLDCLTLDTTLGFPRCSANKLVKCLLPMGRDMVVESNKALLAIGEFIEGKVPPAVKLNVLGPCNLCSLFV